MDFLRWFGVGWETSFYETSYYIQRVNHIVDSGDEVGSGCRKCGGGWGNGMEFRTV